MIKNYPKQSGGIKNSPKSTSQGTWRAKYAHTFIALPPQVFVARWNPGQGQIFFMIKTIFEWPITLTVVAALDTVPIPCDKTSDWLRKIGEKRWFPRCSRARSIHVVTRNRFPTNNIIVVDIVLKTRHCKSAWQTMPSASSTCIILYFSYNRRWGVKAAWPTEW